jgi:hypothetical protein
MKKLKIEDQKDILHNWREKIEKMVLGTNNVDRLMREKVEDYILCEELPISIKVGQYRVWVGTFNLNNDYKFWHIYGKILANVGLQFVNFDMLKDGTEMWKTLTLHKKLYKGLRKLVAKTILNNQEYWCNERSNPDDKVKLPKVSIKYFCNHMTKEKLIEMCFLIYIYNFDSEKKNLQIVAKRMVPSSLMETYIYSWLKSCTGLTGKFQLALYPNPDWWSEDITKNFIHLKREKQEKLAGNNGRPNKVNN